MNSRFLNSFHLKMIAMITMVIDHIGAYFFINNNSLYLVFRYIGRLSFPIFAFLITEGMFYSKNTKKYLLRLFILDLIINLGSLLFLKEYTGSVLLTFVIGGLIIFLLEKQQFFYKILAILPLGFGFLTSFSFFPIKMTYGFYGLCIILVFYLSKKLAYFLANQNSNNRELLNNDYFRTLYISISLSFYIVLSLITTYFANDFHSFFTGSQMSYGIQSFSIISVIILFFYNGKKGYTSKYIQYGCYLFFPLHFIILYIIKLLLNL